jgi:hypothetical protein
MKVPFDGPETGRTQLGRPLRAKAIADRKCAQEIA